MRLLRGCNLIQGFQRTATVHKVGVVLFSGFTGLKVNVGKSEIVPVGNVNNLDALANILHCRVDSLPMKYLGMPLGTSFKTASFWNPILEKMEKKLLGGSVSIYLRVVGSCY